MFQIKDRDAGGRITELEVNNYKITCPTIMPVINPNKMIITPNQMKEFGAEIIITNSFIINRNENLRERIRKNGLHKFLKWKGPIYTDSGTFQMYSQRIKEINPEKIIRFQKSIGSDIITPVDIFTFPFDSQKLASLKLKQTIKTIKQAGNLVKKQLLVGPIQGGSYLELRERACKSVSKINPDIFAIGGIVPLMEKYRFKELCDIILTCKTSLPAGKPVHAFGAGHPMIFSLLTAVGCDLFDSAMYSLAAQRDSYLTVEGTYNLKDLQEFPCSCPLCSSAQPAEIRELSKEKREMFLAKHNLYATFQELRTIRQAIKEQRLWELVQIRARSHPYLLEALQFVLKKYKNYFLRFDSFTKKSFFYLGEESNDRPEVLRAKQMLKGIRSSKYFMKEPFGKIPLELKDIYPFSQSVVPNFKNIKEKTDSRKSALKIIQYQYGKAPKLKRIKVEISRKTNRFRRLWGDGKLIGTFRPSDCLFIPTFEGSKLIQMKKVYVNDREVAEFIQKGCSLFAKFVSKCDKDIVPGMEVQVIYKKPIASGRALLNSQEMKEFNKGAAVKTR